MSAAAAVTIDVDSLACYRAIHGLPARADDGDPVFLRALPRFLDVLARLGVRATLFVVGSDLGSRAHAAVVADAAAAGHEIASHSFAHDYGMSRWPRERVARDLEDADVAIAGATGVRPRGFRAPGYNQSEAIFDVLEERGYRYDSSFFPTPAYFGLRAAALALYRARGRPSRSLVGDVREFLAPRAPFVPSATARFRAARDGERRRRLVEVPIGVASPLRLPWLGTSLALAHDLVGDAITRAVLANRATPAVLELHAIDFLARGDGAEAALIAAQPDLRVDLDDKLRRLERAMRAMAERREVLTLLEIAARVGVGERIRRAG